MRYLLDSSVLLDHLRGHGPATWLLTRLLDEGADLLTCEAAIAEVSAAVPSSARDVVDHLIDQLEFVPGDRATARDAGERHRAGSPIHASLIVAAARKANATLVARGRADIEQGDVPILTY